ncbi:hypothetical protein LTR28_013562 [Elasticomyces elasticus]|nr:hypothetical protein LTR28_013562 [Elasticomyces elasticus]
MDCPRTQEEMHEELISPPLTFAHRTSQNEVGDEKAVGVEGDEIQMLSLCLSHRHSLCDVTSWPTSHLGRLADSFQRQSRKRFDRLRERLKHRVVLATSRMQAMDCQPCMPFTYDRPRLTDLRLARPHLLNLQSPSHPKNKPAISGTLQ